MKLEFFVPGKAAPGGSKKGFVNPRTGRVVIQDDCKRNGSWMDRVAHFASEHYDGEPLLGPLEVEFHFILDRPKGHYGSGKNLATVKASAPKHPTVKPDTTKLIRAAEDALKGITWKDDAQIVRQTGLKTYGKEPGCRITIWTMEG
jgi:Holliday junction resolvase RusA-like endonuclease